MRKRNYTKTNQLKGLLDLFLHNTLVHKIGLAVKRRFKSILFRH